MSELSILRVLPKNPVKRFFYKLHPKRMLKYWFSKQGLFMALKITAGLIILAGITIAAAFAYVSKDLNQVKTRRACEKSSNDGFEYYDEMVSCYGKIRVQVIIN